MHGQRLHGFALLVTLGNRPVAAAAAARALAAGTRRAAELRHPERAAAWLRGRVLRLLPREPGRLSRDTEPERRAALSALGVSDEAFVALASLRTTERAVLVAAAVEGLAERDVESIVGRRGVELRRSLLHARSRYLSVAIGAGSAEPNPVAVPDSLAARIADEAARTLGVRSRATR